MRTTNYTNVGTASKDMLYQMISKQHLSAECDSNKCFQCGECSQCFASMPTLTEHIQCQYCDRVFPRASSLRTHSRTHKGKNSFKCPQCKKTFSTLSTLRRHCSTHSQPRPHQCPHCEKAFAKKSDLIRHFRCHSGERPYQCPHCEKAFSQSGNLQEHIRCHVHTAERPCSAHTVKRLISKYGLDYHICTHTGERPYY